MIKEGAHRSAELGGKGRDAMRHELKLYERLPPHPNVIGLLGAFWRGGDAASSSSGYGAGSAMPHGASWRWCSSTPIRATCTGTSRPSARPP